MANPKSKVPLAESEPSLNRLNFPDLEIIPFLEHKVNITDGNKADSVVGLSRRGRFAKIGGN